MTGFRRGLVLVTIGNYAAIAISFGTSIMLARTLGAQRFGQLALLMTASYLLSMLAANWSLTGLVHFAAREFGVRGVLADSLWARSVVLLPVLAAAVVCVWRLSDLLAAYLGVARWGVWVVFGHFVSVATLNTSCAVLQASGQGARYGVALFLEKALALVILLGVRAVGSLDAVAVIACYSVSAVGVALWGFGSVGRKALFPVHVGRGPVVAMWRFCLPLIFGTWVGLLGTQWIDYVMIRRYLPLAELGLYSLSYQVAGVVQQVTIIMSTLLLPLFSVMIAEGGEDRLRRIVNRGIPYWLLSFSGFLGLLLAAADWVIRIFFGSAFAGAVPSLAVLMLATIALATFNSLAPLLTAAGATWTITAVVGVSAGVNVGMNLALIPRFGIIGAAVATALAYAVSAGMILIAVGSRFGLPVARYALFVVPVAAVYLCRVTVQGVGFYPAAAVALGLAIWGVVRAFRLFDYSDLALLDSVTLPKWVRGVLRLLFTLRGGRVEPL